jgi:hypothetical protein
MDHAASTWIAPVLRPVAPPRVVEGVYTDDQHARILQVVKAHGPWPTITAHHFDTIEELVATSTGVVPDGLSLTLDDSPPRTSAASSPRTRSSTTQRCSIASTTSASSNGSGTTGASVTRSRR